MRGVIMTKLLQFLGKRLDGRKTFIGGLGLILTGIPPIIYGILGILGIMFPDQNLPQVEIEQAWENILMGSGSISLGFGALGLGGKAEKVKTAIENTRVVSE